MAIEMFLFFYPKGSTAPIILDVLAWSWGISSNDTPPTRSRRRAPVAATSDRKGKEKKPTFDMKKPPCDWNVAEVSQWLEAVDLKDCVEPLRKAGIDGETLIALNEADLKELGINSIPLRHKLQLRLEDATNPDTAEAEREDGAPNINCQDLSCTIYMGAQLLRGGVLPVLSGAHHDRVAIICYTPRPGGRHGGRDNDPGIKAGTPYIAIELFDVTISSVSTGGSGGEDRLTANITMMFKRVLQHMLPIKDTKNVDALLSTFDLSGSERDALRSSIAAAKAASDAAKAIEGDDDEAKAAKEEALAGAPSVAHVLPGFTVDYTNGKTGTITQWTPENSPFRAYPYPNPTALENAAAEDEFY